MHDEPDLTAELDAAEAIVMGGATVVTEWGVRYQLAGVEQVDNDGTDEAGARRGAAGVYARLGGTLVRRTVTYGPWEPVNPLGQQPVTGEEP